MKRFPIAVLVLAAVLVLSGSAAAQGGKNAEPAKAASATLKGELVDMGCYLGHGARGEKHAGCATKCIAGGMPMGLLTADGKLYLVTMSHENADPYNSLKTMAAKTVEITGPTASRDGVASIEADAVKLAANTAK